MILARIARALLCWGTDDYDPLRLKDKCWYVFQCTPRWDKHGMTVTWIAGRQWGYYRDRYNIISKEGPYTYEKAARIAHEAREQYSAWYEEHAPKTGDFL